MGRYTLVNKNKEISEYTKVYLETIDKACLEEGSDSLKQQLRLKGINISNLKVNYKANHYIHSLDVLDDRYSFLKRLRVLDGKIDVTDGLFRSKVNEILDDLIDFPELREYVFNKSDINSKVIEYIDKYIYERSSFNYNKLLEHLSPYIQFRKLLVIDTEYTTPRKNEEVSLEDPLDFSDDELPISPYNYARPANQPAPLFDMDKKSR